jgi:hypothetical protein
MLPAVQPRPAWPVAAIRGRSPVPAIAGSLAAGLLLAIVVVLAQTSGASEPSITGSVLVAFAAGWGLLASTSSRFTSQPQRWAWIPAASLGMVGLGLIVLQPGPSAMDLLSWIWPPALAILAVWMVAQVRRSLRGRGRWLVYPAIAVLLALAVGGGLTTVTTAASQTAAPQSGRMVDVGGHRLYLECTGSGSPVVVLQAGLTNWSSAWEGIAPAVATSTTVCAYDRAGYGRSDDVAAPQDGIAIATDLRTLLERAGVAGPYVLVGHSSGADYVRVFADRYPDQVAGMVLLDAQPAEAFTVLPDYPGTYAGLKTLGTLSPSLARVGLLGLILEGANVRAALAGRDEVYALPAALEPAQALTSIGDRPLIVVSAGTGGQRGWLDAQKRLTGLSTQSEQRVIATATHESLMGDDAAASSSAILDVVRSVRGG